MKQHLLVSTVFAIFLVYFLYEVVTSYVVVCRDAYVTADIVVIAPEVSGPMLERGVSNDQQVKAGAPLFTIDPKPFQILLTNQKAALELAEANLNLAPNPLTLPHTATQPQ